MDQGVEAVWRWYATCECLLCGGILVCSLPFWWRTFIGGELSISCCGNLLMTSWVFLVCLCAQTLRDHMTLSFVYKPTHLELQVPLLGEAIFSAWNKLRIFYFVWWKRWHALAMLLFVCSPLFYIWCYAEPAWLEHWNLSQLNTLALLYGSSIAAGMGVFIPRLHVPPSRTMQSILRSCQEEN